MTEILSSRPAMDSSTYSYGSDAELNLAETDQSFGVHIHMSRGPVSSNQARRLRIVNPDRLPKRTVVNMVAGVGTFERWLWENSRTDRRSIVDIPPRELDAYLADFFATVTTPSGYNYKVESFQALKVSIFRYLKEANYPECPKTSTTFLRSLNAYRQRREKLRDDTIVSK